jgi:hypothetical protein
VQGFLHERAEQFGVDVVEVRLQHRHRVRLPIQFLAASSLGFWTLDN